MTIRQVTIPAGTWVVTAKANPVNFGAADYVRCRIVVGGVQRDAAATLIGNAAPGPTGETGPSVAAIALQAALQTTASKVFKLDCLHDSPTPGMYVDPGASIMIVKAPGPIGLTARGGVATAAGFRKRQPRRPRPLFFDATTRPSWPAQPGGLRS